jgi:integrase/recombinase XerD
MKNKNIGIHWNAVAEIIEEKGLIRPVGFEAAVNDFFDARIDSLSPHTVSDYRLTLKRARIFFGGDRVVGEIAPRDVREFITTIPGGRKNKLNALIALGSFWTFCLNEGYAADHVIHRIEKPKPTQVIIHAFTKGEVEKMLAAARMEPIRDRAIILVLVDTGLRATELCNIKIGDLRGEFVTVLGKGNKEREVPLSGGTLRVILETLAAPRRPGKYLFQSEKGPRLTRNGLYEVIERTSKRAKVENAFPHRFRHTFAINYLLNGGDPYSLQKILGHTTMDMVKRYLSLVKEDLARQHAKASPVENWHLVNRDVLRSPIQPVSGP